MVQIALHPRSSINGVLFAAVRDIPASMRTYRSNPLACHRDVRNAAQKGDIQMCQIELSDPVNCLTGLCRFIGQEFEQLEWSTVIY